MTEITTCAELEKLPSLKEIANWVANALGLPVSTYISSNDSNYSRLENLHRIKQAMIAKGWGYESQYPFSLGEKADVHYFLFRHKALNIGYCAWKETEYEAVMHATAKALLKGE